MSNLLELRRSAREIFKSALHAVDACEATRHVVSLEDSHLTIRDTKFEVLAKRIYVVGIGKAALSMALGVVEQLGNKITAGVITCPALTHSLLPSWQTFFGGHPLPNEASLAAARAAFELLDRANAEQAVVIFLISGGGSAMIEWPSSDEISFDDLREANRLLVACGARISETNAVRRAFSSVKGGALARRAQQAELITLIISDTNPGDEASVASGPTLPQPAESCKPMEVINRYRLRSVLPASVLQTVQQAGNDTSWYKLGRNFHYVLLDNRTALDAALARATTLGFAIKAADGICEQPIDEGCELLLSQLWAFGLPDGMKGNLCLVSGGEFSCPVRGTGRGGRNLETALRCSIGIDQKKHEPADHTVVLSAGTDGIDGNSPAAGAIADETTIQRARDLGLSAELFLEQSDSYGFFERLGDLIVTGPTGTNVRDIRILLRGK